MDGISVHQGPRVTTGLSAAVERVESLVEQRISAGHAPGMIVAITDAERTVAMISAGVADAGDGTPYSASSLIRLDSLTKPFVALAVLQEFERGRLRPDTRVSRILPWCGLQEPYGPITLHHLLTHTAGLPRGSDVWADPLFPTYQVHAIRPGGPPGIHFHYSNYGWKLIGLILEEVAGRPLQSLLEERVLAPMGMTASLARIETEQLAALVPRYCRMRPGRPLLRGQSLAQVPWTPHAAADGCVAATVDDMCRFARVMLNEGVAESGRLLSPVTFPLMFRRWVAEDDVGWYGYGWWVYERNGTDSFMHPGYQPGSSCIVLIDPSTRLAAFVAANGLFDVRAVGEYALAAVRASLRGEPLPSPPRPRRPDRILRAADYVGEYRGSGSFELRQDGAGLRFRGYGIDRPVQRVDPDMQAAFSFDTLVVAEAPFDRHFLEFERSGQGAVIGAYHGEQRYGRIPYPPDDEPLPPEWRAYCGSYRSLRSTDSVTITGRRGRLWLLDEWQTTPLCPVGETAFRIGDREWIPEILVFDGLTPHGASRVRTADGEGVWYRISAGRQE